MSQIIVFPVLRAIELSYAIVGLESDESIEQERGNLAHQGSLSFGAPALAEKLRFLSAPSAYAHAPVAVEVVETHMSYVFLAGDRAYKLKKPVRYPFLDFSTIEAREHDCREEVRLNRRLSTDVYIGVAPLTILDDRLAIAGRGAVVDWLVVMRRLPGAKMLDRLIRSDHVGDAEIGAVCDVLSRFYLRAERAFLTPGDYVQRFFKEQGRNRELLTRPEFGFDHGCAALLDRLDKRITAERARLETRVALGAVVDGHGDLRPEHICLTEPIVIFDCLEFNAELRQVDPFDEIALLGVECAQLGAPQLMRRFAEALAERLNCAPPWELISLYAAARAALRARLSIAHLMEPSPRDPSKWKPLARRYLDIAGQALALAI